MKWPDAVEQMQRFGIRDEQGLDSIRPLVERFKSIAINLNRQKSIRKQYSGIGALQALFLFEMQLGEPVLHLQFLDENEEVLFESRELTANTMGTAVAMLNAIAQSFELANKRKLALRSSMKRYVAEGLSDILEQITRIAVALDIPQQALLDSSSEPKSSESESLRVEPQRGERTVVRDPSAKS